MSSRSNAPSLTAVVYAGVMCSLATYFTFASVQGDFGLFQRIQIEAEAEILEEKLETLKAQVEVMENKTLRLSDSALDLDLLDHQARAVVGMARPDEIILR